MTNTNATNFRKNVFDYLNQAVLYNDVVNVNTKNGNAVVLSEADYRGIMETIYLLSDSEVKQNILEAKNAPDEDFIKYDPAEEW